MGLEGDGGESRGGVELEGEGREVVGEGGGKGGPASGYHN